MRIRLLLIGLICVLFSLPSSVLADKETNVLVLGQYQGQYETIIVNLYNSDHFSTQIISIHPGTIFVDGTEILQRTNIHQALHQEGLGPVQKALGSYLGLDIPFYLIVDYGGAQAVVDVLGGVTFNMPYELHLPACGELEELILQPGVQLFDGETARRVLRYRSSELYSPEELRVIELQQSFLHTMIQQLAQEKWKIIPIALKLPKMIKTNLGIRQFLDLALDALRLDPEVLDINFGVIPGTFISINGEYQYQVKGLQRYRIVEY